MKFKQDDKIATIFFDDDVLLEVGKSCDSIVVCMENGQMEGVPWFEVWKDGKIISKWNAAKCKGVLLIED